MGFKMKQRFDKFWVGVILGLIGAAVGFVLFGLVWSLGTDHSFTFYIRDVFEGVTSLFQDKIVTISILIDVVLFYLFLRIHWYNLAKGLLAVVILSVPVALYLY
jgi:hypothetical protein